jgi:hypothetical protein|tara:strand:+ start:27 stop:623 length:597 start_codon:yes stop_codon:yes gene_type:complete
MTSRKFVGAILLSTLVLVLWMKYTPAEARNEYLNSYSSTCQYGSVDLSVEQSQDDTDYRHYSPSNDYDNFSNRKSLRLSFRKNLGVTKKMCDEQNKILLENENLRQELEMLKVCQRYADRPLPPQFSTVERMCTGLRARPVKEKSEDPLWDEMKKEYLDENPGVDVYDASKYNTPVKKNKPLKIPKYLTDEPLPVPTN